MALETKYGHYEEAFAQSDALVAELNTKLLELDQLIYSAECATMVTVSPLAVPELGACAWARLVALGGSTLSGAETGPTGRPAIASGTRASRLQSR